MRSRSSWAAVLALLGVLLVSGVARAQPPEVVVPEGAQDGRARLVVGGDGPIAVMVAGRPQAITTTPLVSERTATALVVDASAEGGPGLPPGLGGLVDFALGVPPATRTALVADTTPPAVVAPTQAGPAGVLSGLSGITPGGDRQTVAALDLAVAQLPREPDGPRLVVLYTGGASTAEAADALAARLRAAGVVLAVVTTADAGYWRTVADGTGGVAVGAAPPGVVDAFGQVARALRTRSLVTLPAPGRSPTPAVVSVGGQSTETVLPPEAGGVDPMIVAAGVVAGLVALALAAVALVRLARRRRPAHEWAAPADEGGRRPLWRTSRRSAPPDEGRQHAASPSPEQAGPPNDRGRRGRRGRRQVWHAPERTAAPTVDRARLRRAIEDALAWGGRAVVRPANGRAGVGVTTAMAEFAHHYREAYDVTWWIAAQDPQLIGDQMARLAEALGVAAPTDTADAATAAALAALRQRGRWLLVFDDAGARHDLARFLPDGSGHVLVGSTEPGWEGPSVAVPAFRRVESVELLRAHHHALTAADADRVATALADVPLDVAAAGATLAATGMSADTYLAALASRATTAPAGPAPATTDARAPAERATASPPAAASSTPADSDTTTSGAPAEQATPGPPAAAASTPAEPDTTASRAPAEQATAGPPPATSSTPAEPDTPGPGAPVERRTAEPGAGGATEAGPGTPASANAADSHPPADSHAPASANAAGSDPQVDPGAPAGQDAAAAAWEVAFERLAADEPQALALLTLVAWLGPEPVPTALLDGPRPAPLATADPAELAAVLADRGLVIADGDSVLLHRVPAAHLVRRTADEHPDGAGWAVWAVHLLRAAVPPDPEDPASWPGWRRLMPHVLAATDPGRALDDVAVEVGWLLHHAARFLQARGEQESARALLEDAHDLYRRRLGPDDPQTLAAARALADNLSALGRHEQARRLLDDEDHS